MCDVNTNTQGNQTKKILPLQNKVPGMTAEINASIINPQILNTNQFEEIYPARPRFNPVTSFVL